VDLVEADVERLRRVERSRHGVGAARETALRDALG
jgi:hypothetical protein